MAVNQIQAVLSGELESVDQAAFRQLHLEGVFALRPGAAQSGLGGAAESLLCRLLPFQGGLDLRRCATASLPTPPSATRARGIRPFATADDHGRGGEGELVGGAVAQLQVERFAARRGRRRA